jgi:threonyl-tRNA synthetase
MAKIPYILVAGDREKEDSLLNVRLRNGENKGALPLADVQHMINEDSREPFKRGGMSYSFSQ